MKKGFFISIAGGLTPTVIFTAIARTQLVENPYSHYQPVYTELGQNAITALLVYLIVLIVLICLSTILLFAHGLLFAHKKPKGITRGLLVSFIISFFIAFIISPGNLHEW